MLLEKPIQLTHHAEFDTTLQRYDLDNLNHTQIVNDVLLKAKLKRLLLYRSHFAVLDNQLIDHDFHRSLFNDKKFQKFLTTSDIDDAPPITVGFRGGTDNLFDVMDNMRKYGWFSSSMPDTNDFFANAKSLSREDFLAAFERLKPQQYEAISKISNFLSNNRIDVRLDLARANYNDLVRDAVESFPHDQKKTSGFEHFLENFKNNMEKAITKKGDDLSRSELIRISEDLAKSDKDVTKKDLIKLQYVCQDIPWNINAKQNHVQSIEFANNMLLDEVLGQSTTLSENSLRDSLQGFDKHEQDIINLPILNKLTFGEIGKIRRSEGFESSLKDLENSGSKTFPHRLRAHEELIASNIISFKKVPDKYRNKISKFYDRFEKWKIPKIMSGAGTVWSVVGLLSQLAPLALVPPVSIPSGLIVASFGLTNHIARRYEKSKYKKAIIAEISLFKKQ